MHKIYILSLFAILLMVQKNMAQPNQLWNGKKCAVVLTYDDALNVHLDKVIPSLDSANFKGTFYVVGNSPVLAARLNDWRKAAQNGHELGNHSLNHPCSSTLPGRWWVSPEGDLNTYTLARAIMEIRVTNTLLQAIDGKTLRTFAYPCGDTLVAGVNYYDSLSAEFAGARGVKPGLQDLQAVNLNNINCYAINGQLADYMTNLVDQAIKTNTLLVFLFHGVGGEHAINVSLEAHQQLVQYLKKHENEIWVAPLVEVAQYIKENQEKNKN